MKNIDAAIEISNKFRCITIGERCKNIEDACLKMAEWKDKEFERRVIFALGCLECRYKSCKECSMGRIKKELLPNEYC